MAKDLLPGERPILQANPHWITLVKSLVVPVLLLIVVVVADLTVIRNTGVHLFRTFVSLGALAIALLWLIVVWIRWRSTSYTLTDQRIMIETGVFSRSEKIIPIDRVQDCSTRQSLFGRILGYGLVEVDAAGAQGAEVLDHLPNPDVFRDQVFVQTERRRTGAPPVQPHPSGV